MEQRGNRTRRKLEEAKFFLEQLEPNYGKVKKFDFYLSAYISSARSVLWVMRSEYADVAGWEIWYKSRKPDREEADLLKGTNEVRIRTEKVEPLSTARTLTIQGINIPPEQLEEFSAQMAKAKGTRIPMRISGTADSCLLEMQIDGEWISYSGAEALLKRELHEFPDFDVLDVCYRYFEAITSVVNECGKRFDA